MNNICIFRFRKETDKFENCGKFKVEFLPRIGEKFKFDINEGLYISEIIDIHHSEMCDYVNVYISEGCLFTDYLPNLQCTLALNESK